MIYSELRSGFIAAMVPFKLKPTMFDFAEAIDAASMLFAASLPEEVIPGLMKVHHGDPASSVDREMTLPADYLKVESVRLATTRDIDDNPVYLPANIVSERHFMNMVSFSDELLVSFFNGRMNFNPALAPAVTGKPGSILMAYRAMPFLYITRKPRGGIGTLLTTLDQVSGQPSNFTTETLAGYWADSGLDTALLDGGTIVINSGTKVYIFNIDYAWDDTTNGYSGLHIEEGNGLSGLPGNVATNSYVVEKPEYLSSGYGMYGMDSESPSLNESFHHIMLDYAIARYLSTRQPQVAQALMGTVIQTLQAVGVSLKIEMGGEEQ